MAPSFRRLMNRSMAMVGIVLIVLGIGLVSFPIVVTGVEQLDLEQIAGFLVAPIGLVVVLIAAVSFDPNQTTVGGTFGNPEETSRTREPSTGAPPRGWQGNPNAPARCRSCRAVITADLSRCPRCSRARDCRGCGRPLGQVLDRPTCPTCARAEPFCNCPILSRPSTRVVGRGPGR